MGENTLLHVMSRVTPVADSIMDSLPASSVGALACACRLPITRAIRKRCLDVLTDFGEYGNALRELKRYGCQFLFISKSSTSIKQRLTKPYTFWSENPNFTRTECMIVIVPPISALDRIAMVSVDWRKTEWRHTFRATSDNLSWYDLDFFTTYSNLSMPMIMPWLRNLAVCPWENLLRGAHVNFHGYEDEFEILRLDEHLNRVWSPRVGLLKHSDGYTLQPWSRTRDEYVLKVTLPVTCSGPEDDRLALVITARFDRPYTHLV